eukprot:scaffold5358_cov68-Phaeocystis_antarctica.AAC.6
MQTTQLTSVLYQELSTEHGRPWPVGAWNRVWDGLGAAMGCMWRARGHQRTVGEARWRDRDQPSRISSVRTRFKKYTNERGSPTCQSERVALSVAGSIAAYRTQSKRVDAPLVKKGQRELQRPVRSCLRP